MLRVRATVNATRTVTFVRDALVATAVVVGLYGLGQGVQFRPVQIPWYLLVVGFDVLEVVFGSAGRNYDLLFGAYLVGLGVASALVATVARSRTADRTQESGPAPATWRLATAGAFCVVGALSLSFAVAVLFGTSQLNPVLITGATALVCFAIAGWLAGVLDPRSERSA